ncbi:flagellar hook-associated protein 1 FlgK [Ruminiclostridium sufflavum DSM 19573]|uniref:Flagellar hook-associated protein 1 n=1 Tax=Ruminiclostridium sufflavum DSM 19573 TaxID=1121337 RepID=A0A318XS90_9FIRM|nr:flagellar hook-associated protein FlgK [Ruminiclostridium sufflavum]PYG89111.1 flagellar hook-associated protein 1 FlgK [Ruminiclostridium sufflavum DSM 19573]
MAVGFSSYQIARSGLKVSERGLFVTGHNIANADTAGYVRQQAIIETSPYQTVYGKNNKTFQYGLGADIQETRQIRNTFLDIIYRQENTSLGYYQTRSSAIEDIEAILNDPMGDGLQKVMNQFWDSWQELSKAPESLTVRALVRERGQAVVYYFNQVGSQLDRLQNDLNSEIQVQIDEVNRITSQIAALNQRIASEEIAGDSANDFRDQRNLLLDKLSYICDAKANEMQDGQVDVTLGGYLLVSKGSSKNLYVKPSSENGNFYYPMLEGTETQINIKSGKLKGLMESRGEVSGIKGNYANGTPNEKIDITFAVDASLGSTELRAQIGSYVDGLEKSGVDYNIRFVSMGSTSSVYNDMVYTSDNIDDFLNDTAGLDAFFSATAADGNFDGLITTLEGLNSTESFRTKAAKVTYVLSNMSINGNNGTPVTAEDAAGYINRLNAIGMKTCIATTEDYENQGEDVLEEGWSTIAYGTGGEVLAIGTDADSYDSLLSDLNSDTRLTVNGSMSNVSSSTNIVSDLKIKLNSLLNSMIREVNYLSSTGFTLDGNSGVNFFKAIDDDYPIEMGNFTLSDELAGDKGLNNIVASSTNAVGDNTISRLIANLRNKDLLEDASGEVSIDEYYRAIILDIGNQGSEAVTAANNQQTLVLSADEQRTAISGVAMDEELSNMMKYKFAYDASSRVLNIIDSMIDKIVNSMGVVGR